LEKQHTALSSLATISTFYSFVDDSETTTTLRYSVGTNFHGEDQQDLLEVPASQDFGTKVLSATLLTAEGGSSMQEITVSR
jgi:hypothetical protein